MRSARGDAREPHFDTKTTTDLRISPSERCSRKNVLTSAFARFWRTTWPRLVRDYSDRETRIRHLMEGQYSHPMRIIAEGWSRDVTTDTPALCEVR